MEEHRGMMNCTIKIKNSELKLMNIALQMMNVALTMMNSALKMMNSALKMMNSALKMMNSGHPSKAKMMNLAFNNEMMNAHGRDRPWKGRSYVISR